MGKSYINTKENNLDLKETYNKFISFKVREASEEKYFYDKPIIALIESIDVEDNNLSCILRLKNNDYVVLGQD